MNSKVLHLEHLDEKITNSCDDMKTIFIVVKTLGMSGCKMKLTHNVVTSNINPALAINLFLFKIFKIKITP